MKKKIITYILIVSCLGFATNVLSQNDSTNDSWESTAGQVSTNETIYITNSLILGGTNQPRGIRRVTQGYNLDLWGGNALRNGATISLSGAARGGENSINNGRMELWTGGDFLETQAAVKGDFQFGTRWLDNDKTLMTLKSSTGRLGIGTTNPTAFVHIQGPTTGYVPGERGFKIEGGWNSYAASIINTSGGNSAGGLLIETTAGGAIEYTDALKVVTYRTNSPQLAFRIPNFSGRGTRVLLVESGGKVGVGTDLPEYELDVCGFTRAKEIIVETDWCDYVFAKEYRLPSLAEQKSFIEKNGHLKNFESEEDMNGQIHVGDVNKRQQQTIEEIMLYLIEMKDEITDLKAENKALKAEMEALKLKK